MIDHSSFLSDLKLLECLPVKAAALVVLQDSKNWRVALWKMGDTHDLLAKIVLIKIESPSSSIKLIGPAHICERIRQYFIECKAEVTKVVIRERPFEVVFKPREGVLQVSRELVPLQEQSQTLSKSVPQSASQSKSQSQSVRVLIVDDSSSIRSVLRKLFSGDPGVAVVGELGDPLEIEKFLLSNVVDVMTLDIHMPGMSGIDVMKKIWPKFKIPTVMISSISKEEGPQVLQALELGAVDYIQKPSLKDLITTGQDLVDRVKTAAESKRKGSYRTHGQGVAQVAGNMDPSKLIAIGSSTGGTEALRVVLQGLPDQIPPIVVVQHIPAVFSLAFAQRLNQICPFEVREAEDNDLAVPNLVLIAPGGQQMKLIQRGSQTVVKITDDEPVNRHKPSVDYLFHSISALKPADTIAVILTGMGKDGAQGMLELKNKGAWTIAQDMETSVVFGMPKAAIELGAAAQVLPIEKIAMALVKKSQSKVRSTG